MTESIWKCQQFSRAIILRDKQKNLDSNYFIHLLTDFSRYNHIVNDFNDSIALPVNLLTSMSKGAQIGTVNQEEKCG